MKIFLPILALIFLTSCGANIESPVIYFSNASAQKIKNIECSWNGKILTLSNLNPGDSRSQSFFINKDENFFGQVHVSWFNHEGDRVAKNFTFKKENLPSIEDKTTYNYVQLYFDQQDLEIITSDITDLSGKVSRMDRMMNRFHDDFVKNTNSKNLCTNNDLNICQRAEDSSLIAIINKQSDITATATY